MRSLQKLLLVAGAFLALSVLTAAATSPTSPPATGKPATSPAVGSAAEGGTGGVPLNLHYAAAALGAGIVVIGAAIGIGRFAAAAAEGIARQPQAHAQITGAVLLPLFLLEGVAIIAVAVCMLVVLTR